MCIVCHTLQLKPYTYEIPWYTKRLNKNLNILHILTRALFCQLKVGERPVEDKKSHF